MTNDKKSQYIVIDPDGNPWGPFDSNEAASEFGSSRWPGRDRGEDDDEGSGWEVVLLLAPDAQSGRS